LPPRKEKFRFGERKKGKIKGITFLADAVKAERRVIAYGFAARNPTRQMIVCFGGYFPDLYTVVVFSKAQRPFIL
jgi:hypothetical protein